MKCICGYEQETPFETYKNLISIGPDQMLVRVHEHKDLYICPKCGTVKFEEAEN